MEKAMGNQDASDNTEQKSSVSVMSSDDAEQMSDGQTMSATAELTADAKTSAVSKARLSNVSDCVMEYDLTNRLIKYNGEKSNTMQMVT